MRSKSHPARARPAPNREPLAAGLAARRAALALLEAGVARRGGFDEALGRAPFADLAPRDRAFAYSLASTMFRRFGGLEQVLRARLQRPPPEPVLALLRLGAAQLLFVDTPAYAAVATTLDLAEADRATRPFKGLLNAVLRGLARDPPAPPEPEADLPPWLAARWRAAYGQETVRGIAARLVEEPPTDLSVRDPAEADALASELDAEILPGPSLRTHRRGEVAEWPGFAEGRWWVQDAAAAIPARLLAISPGQTALDLCAAPGGKTLQLAAAGAKVTALDRSAGRLRRLSENLARTGLKAEVIAADAPAWGDPRRFDAVLLDAPCSATGTFRRHPDVLWAARPGDIAALVEVQTRLLEAAARRVAPGGRLVYCVCSLEPEEGEGQAGAFLARHPEFQGSPVQPGEGGAPAEAVAADGALRILPGLDPPAAGMDGFFVSRFVRAN